MVATGTSTGKVVVEASASTTSEMAAMEGNRSSHQCFGSEDDDDVQWWPVGRQGNRRRFQRNVSVDPSYLLKFRPRGLVPLAVCTFWGVHEVVNPPWMVVQRSSCLCLLDEFACGIGNRRVPTVRQTRLWFLCVKCLREFSRRVLAFFFALSREQT